MLCSISYSIFMKRNWVLKKEMKLLSVIWLSSKLVSSHANEQVTIIEAKTNMLDDWINSQILRTHLKLASTSRPFPACFQLCKSRFQTSSLSSRKGVASVCCRGSSCVPPAHPKAVRSWTIGLWPWAKSGQCKQLQRCPLPWCEWKSAPSQSGACLWNK